MRVILARAWCNFSQVAPDAGAALPTPRSNVRSTPDGGAAVQPPGLSYTAHWEALGSALRLLTTRAISCTGPVWGRGSGPSSCRPRARIACVVWAWDLFCYVVFFAVESRLLLVSSFFALRFATVCHTYISPENWVFFGSCCEDDNNLVLKCRSQGWDWGTPRSLRPAVTVWRRRVGLAAAPR
jgi:hypothetical protein